MSHSSDKIKNFNPFYEAFSALEIRKIARSFLLFLADTHEHHISSFLDPNQIRIIKEWESEFFENTNS